MGRPLLLAPYIWGPCYNHSLSFMRFIWLPCRNERNVCKRKKLLVTNPADHIFPPRPTELQITIELERKYGNRGATMAPLSMPELLEALNDRPSPMPEEQAAQYLGPTEAYIQALANQVKYRPDPSRNQVDPKDKDRFAHWFAADRTKPAPNNKFAIQQGSRFTSSSSRHGGGTTGEKRPAHHSWQDRGHRYS